MKWWVDRYISCLEDKLLKHAHNHYVEHPEEANWGVQVLSPWHFNQMLEVRSNDQPASWLQRGISFTSILLTLWDEKQKTDAWKALLLTLTLTTLTYLQTSCLRNSLREGRSCRKPNLHSFQRNPRADLLQNGLVGSPCSPRDSQESSPTPQFKSINSAALSFLHSPTLTSIHDHRKNHSLD